MLGIVPEGVRIDETSIFRYKKQSLTPGDTMPNTPKTVAQLEAKIAQLERQVKRLKAQTITDTLTSLYSRRFFDDRVKAVQSEARRKKHMDVFVLFVDVDHFKRVNDRYGHRTGDRVLAGIARRIQNAVRQNDIAARYGGEEIIVLGRGDAAVVAERIRKSVAETAIVDVAVTVSIGFAYFRSDDANPLNVTIARADEAVYQAKKSGRNQVCEWKP